MNRQCAKIEDILGIDESVKQCVFYQRFKYDPCRSCIGQGRNKGCENYTPIIVRVPRRSISLPKTIDMIRRYNDEGVI